jgi:hypothetical protein
VKALQKIIFRTHNEGDSVKISLPIENIIDIEDSQIVDFADTCKIRVIDNDETYAIDEVSDCVPLSTPLADLFRVFFLFLQFWQGSIECSANFGRGHHSTTNSGRATSGPIRCRRKD